MRISKPLAIALMLTLAGCGALPQTLPASVGGDAGALGKALRALAPDLPRGEKQRPVTLLSYLPIDDGLDFHIPFYLNTLERTTSERIYNVAFTDAKGPGNSLLHLVGADKTDKVVSRNAPVAKGVTEVTSNDPETLAKVAAWAYSSYPGEFKAFSYLGHGGGYMGIGTDDTPAAGDKRRFMFTVDEFGTGLKRGLKGRKLNLIHLHACLMANVEAAYNMRDVAEVLFASQDVVGAHQEGTEKPTEILNTLLQQPNPDARKVAKETVIRVNPRQDPYGYATASAIDLDRIAEVKSAINVLSRDMMAALPTQGAEIKAAYMAVPEFKNYANSGQRDLWTFCNKLAAVKNPAIQKAALDVKQAMRGALLHTRDNEGAAANGLSIFMPRNAQALKQAEQFNYAGSRFAKDTQWDEFLEKLISAK